MKLSDKQQEVVDSNYSTTVCLSAPASGKALSNDSIVYTDVGQKKISEIKIGEKIYGQDGKLSKVLGVYPQGEKEEYKVTFSDGTEIFCCEEHLWTFQTASLRSKKSKKWITTSLKQIIEEYPLFIKDNTKNNFGNSEVKRKNIFIPMCEPIQFTEKEVEIEPYTMGALLGDGSFVKSIFTNEDLDVLEYVEEGLQKIGCHLKYKSRYDYSIISNGKHIFSTILKKYGLWQLKSDKKFIPSEYKYNSIDNRIALIQGIIDTDGYCEGSSYDIVLKSKQLILDIKEVCESLGLTAVYSEKKAICTNSISGIKDCGTAYRLRIKTSKNILKLHRSRKREKQWKPSKVYSHRAITNIEKTNRKVKMTCIQVDNENKLFVTNNFIVTHNTLVLTERTKKLLNEGIDPKQIVLITFTNAAAEEMRKRIGEKAKDSYIGTIHGFANYILLYNGINTYQYIQDGKFDELFEAVKKVSYIPHFEHLLLDEAQDTSSIQWDFILNFINPTNLFVVADYRQELYSWRGSDTETLRKLQYRKDSKVFHLNENYRNGQNILNYAAGYMLNNKLDYSYRDNSICCSGREGIVIKQRLDYDYIVEQIKKYDSFGDWFILTRTNEQLENFYFELEKRGIPCVSFKQADLNNAELTKVMNSNKVKVLTVHSSKGLENKNVMVYGCRVYNKDEILVSYVAATRAKDRLYWLSAPAKKTKTNIINWE